MLGTRICQQQAFQIVRWQTGRWAMLLPEYAFLLLIEPPGKRMRVVGSGRADDKRAAATLSQPGQQRVFQRVSLVALPMAPFIQDAKDGRAAKHVLGIGRHDADHMVAAVAFVFDLKRRCPPERQRLALRRGKIPGKSVEIVPANLSLVAGTRADNDLAPRLPVELAQKGAQRNAG